MTILHKTHPSSELVELNIDSPPTVADYQACLPKLLKESIEHSARKWLVIVEFADQERINWAQDFTAFVCNELKFHIDKIAVVCDHNLWSLVLELLVPIKNYGKQVHVFNDRDAALQWISQEGI